MRNLRVGRRVLRLVLVAIVTLAVAAAVAYATIPDAAGVIHGCYRASLDDQKGQLRIVDDPTSCRSNETEIQWNQQGVAGAPGTNGIDGTTGPPGDTGPTGPAGATGAQGPQGETGATGAQGPQGETGAAGTDGTDGSDGQPGTNGAPGAKGDTGDTGPAGPTGAPGAKGDTGAQGPQGPAGLSDTLVHTQTVSTPPSTTEIDSATCPGTHPKVTGGGYEIGVGWESFAQVVDTRPLAGGQGWAVRMKNIGTALALPYTIWAICVQ